MSQFEVLLTNYFVTIFAGSSTELSLSGTTSGAPQSGMAPGPGQSGMAPGPGQSGMAPGPTVSGMKTTTGRGRPKSLQPTAVTGKRKSEGKLREMEGPGEAKEELGEKEEASEEEEEMEDSSESERSEEERGFPETTPVDTGTGTKQRSSPIIGKPAKRSKSSSN